MTLRSGTLPIRLPNTPREQRPHIGIAENLEGFAPLSGRGGLTPLSKAANRGAMNFRQMLQVELVKRRERNPRYSLRAFAAYLGTDHATLSQIIRGRRHLSPRMVRRLGGRLRLAPRELADACVQQNAEAILRLARSASFRTHSRWIASRAGIALDGVNTALHWLLSHGKLVMTSADSWTLT
jgi:hypothetical protein